MDGYKLWLRIRKIWLWRSASYRRLCGAVTAYRTELNSFIEQCKKDGVTNLAWAYDAGDLLNKAQQALDNNDADLGWHCFNAAQRIELLRFAEPGAEGAKALKARASVILSEGKSKLTSWRQQSVISLLTQNGKLRDDLDVVSVIYASQVLHENNDNIYVRLGAIERQMGILAFINFIALAISIYLLAGYSMMNDTIVIDNPQLIILVALFGVMGACISSMFSLARGSTNVRIPQQLLNSLINFARPIIGASSALLLYAASVSKVINIGQITPQLILVVAFAAGFSERLVMRVIGSVSKEEKGK